MILTDYFDFMNLTTFVRNTRFITINGMAEVEEMDSEELEELINYERKYGEDLINIIIEHYFVVFEIGGSNNLTELQTAVNTNKQQKLRKLYELCNARNFAECRGLISFITYLQRLVENFIKNPED